MEQNNKKGFKHLTSNHPVIFFTQAIIAVAVIFVVSFIAYLLIFGKSNRIASNIQRANINMNNILQDKNLGDGVDESMFVDNVEGIVSQDTINTLFPKIK